jgi:gliding motility-associated protein GldM
MSIPKEPRQLMINLMYLVLTAILALNVSAEIINAFFALEKGIMGTSKIVDESNNDVKKNLDEWVKKPGNQKFAIWNDKAAQALAISKEFEDFVEKIRKDIFDAAGGPNPEHPDRPVKYKDKDVTTRLLIMEGRGASIEKKIVETRNKLLALIDDPSKKVAFAASFPLLVDEIPKDSESKNWPDYKFKQMPVAAVMPMFAKLNSDSKSSTTQLLNYFMDQAAGKTELRLDKYIVAIAPVKSYLISGKDRFEATIALGAYSSVANNISITANGSGVPLKEGLAKYSGGVESGTGEKTFTATATITNPITGEKITSKADVKYEVGQTSVTVAADKMNVFYIGVDNPISIAAAGVSSNSLKVSVNGGGTTISGSAKNYTVKATTQGDCNVVVSSPEMAAPATFKFRVKRIPDPIPILGKKGQSNFGNGEIKAQEGIIALLEISTLTHVVILWALPQYV